MVLTRIEASQPDLILGTETSRSLLGREPMALWVQRQNESLNTPLLGQQHLGLQVLTTSPAVPLRGLYYG